MFMKFVNTYTCLLKKNKPLKLLLGVEKHALSYVRVGLSNGYPGCENIWFPRDSGMAG